MSEIKRSFEEIESPGQRMDKLISALKRKRSIQGIRTAVSEVLNAKPSDMKEFSKKIGNHRWRGIVYQKRNSLMGTIVSFFDNKIFVVRGYPKVKYSDDSRVYGRECSSWEKIDGSNVGIFLLPDGTIMGKTRMTANWDQESWGKHGKSWEQMIKSIDGGNLLIRIGELLGNHDYAIYGELYGYENPGDFIKYSIPLNFKVFDILDLKTQRFLEPGRVRELCELYFIPYAKEMWSGTLTGKEVERIEFQLKEEMKLDGMEGWVAKTYLEEERDVYCCKLKCQEIREKCWEESTPTIPTNVIRKAIRKTLENNPDFKTIEEIEPIVNDELREEVEEDLLIKSRSKIQSQIRHILTPTDESLYKLVEETMNELEQKGISLEDKAKVLSSIAFRIGDINGGTLFRIYTQIMIKRRKEI